MTRRSTGRRAWPSLLMASCTFVACAAPLPPPPKPVAVVRVAPPPARPSCGAVEVNDRTVPTSPAYVGIVRDSLREQLASFRLCARPYRLHVDLVLEPAGLGRVRARLVLVVYGKGGALAGEIPVTLSGDQSSPSDLTATDALLRMGATQAAKEYMGSFR